MRYVYGQDEAVARFAAGIIAPGRPLTFGPCRAIGVLDDGNRPLAAIVFNHYRREEGTVELSVAALPKSRWFSRETIRRMFEYPFVELKCQLVYEHVRADNEPLLRLMANLGHAFIAMPRWYGRDADGVLAQLTIEEWQTHPIHRRCRRSTEQIREAA